MSKTENELAEILANLISSIDVADERKPGQFFARELQEQLGFGKDRAYKTCQSLHKLGKIKPVKIRVLDPWGQRKTFAGWEVVDENQTPQT